MQSVHNQSTGTHTTYHHLLFMPPVREKCSNLAISIVP